MPPATQDRLLDFLRDGITAAKAGNKVQARQLLREITDADPNHELAWLWLAGVAETPHDSLAYLQRVLEINPDNAQARRGLTNTRLQVGIAEGKAGRKRTARRYLQEVVKSSPDNEVAWLWLGGLAETSQDALACLQRVLQVNPANQHAQQGLRSVTLQAGIAEAKAGNQAAARRHLRAVLDQEPRNESAWQWLAEVAESPAEAIQCLDRALEINPASVSALESYCWYRVRIDSRSGRWMCPFCRTPAARLERGCPACGAVLTLDDLTQFFSPRSIRTEHLEAAVIRLQGTLDLREDLFDHYLLGLACLNLRKLDQAIQHFQNTLAQLAQFPNLVDCLAELEQLQAAAQEEARRKRAQQRCILVVDDSPTVRKLVTMTMEREGFLVMAAADATEAQQRLRERVPNLIFLDITMPGMDGYQLCKLLKGAARTAHVPVVMLSGKDGFFDKIRGRMAGSTEYLTKPFKPDLLVEVAQKHCVKAS